MDCSRATRPTRRRAVAALGAAALALAALPSLGCNAGGAILQKVGGPPTVQPQYRPGAKTAVVLAENFRSPTAAAVDADRLAAMVTSELRRHRVFYDPDAVGKQADLADGVEPAADGEERVGRLLDPGVVASLRTREPAAYPSMDVAEVGRRVGAGRVLYLDLQSAGADAAAGGNFYKGFASATVKWVDAATGDVLWPTDFRGGYPVSAETPVRNPRTPGVSAESVRGEALRRLAGDVGRLFYPYKPDEVNAPMDDPL